MFNTKVSPVENAYFVPPLTQNLIIDKIMPELLALVATRLDIANLRNFELTCKHFRNISASIWPKNEKKFYLNLTLDSCSPKQRNNFDLWMVQYIQGSISEPLLSSTRRDELASRLKVELLPDALRKFVDFDLHHRLSQSWLEIQTSSLTQLFTKATPPPSIPQIWLEMKEQKEKTEGDYFVLAWVSLHCGLYKYAMHNLKKLNTTESIDLKGITDCFRKHQVRALAISKAQERQYELMERYFRHIRFYQELFEDCKDFPPAHAWAAAEMLRQRNFAAAKAKIDKAIVLSKNQNTARTMELAGQIYAELNELEKADEFFSNVWEIRKSKKAKAKVLQASGYVKLNLGQYREAHLLLSKAVRKYKGKADAKLLEDVAKAKELIDKEKELNSQRKKL